MYHSCKKIIHSAWKIHATCQKRVLAVNIAIIILGSNTFEKMRGRSILFSFYFFISVWISMSPNNPIKMWSLNHYRLGRMLINNSCSWVSYFDKYRTDKKHRTRELSAFAKLLPKRSRKNEDISKRNCYQAIAKLSAVNKLSTLFCLTPTLATATIMSAGFALRHLQQL